MHLNYGLHEAILTAKSWMVLFCLVFFVCCGVFCLSFETPDGAKDLVLALCSWWCLLGVGMGQTTCSIRDPTGVGASRANTFTLVLTLWFLEHILF